MERLVLMLESADPLLSEFMRHRNHTALPTCTRMVIGWHLHMTDKGCWWVDDLRSAHIEVLLSHRYFLKWVLSKSWSTYQLTRPWHTHTLHATISRLLVMCINNLWRVLWNYLTTNKTSWGLVTLGCNRDWVFVVRFLEKKLFYLFLVVLHPPHSCLGWCFL